MLQALLDWLNSLLGGGAPTTPTQPSITAYIGHSHLDQNLMFVNDPMTEMLGGSMNSLASLPLLERASLIDTVDPIKIEAAKNNKLDKAKIIGSVISVEAGYVNHPSDKGGETNLGITKAVAIENQKMLKERFNWDGKMVNLTYDMAFAIYETIYWKKMGLDDIVKLSPTIADRMFDIGVNAGSARAVLWLQEGLRVLNRKGADYADINPDGVYGNATYKALKAYFAKNGSKQGSLQMLTILITSQGNHYKTISLQREANEDFIHGWLNRVRHHLDMYASMLK